MYRIKEKTVYTFLFIAIVIVLFVIAAFPTCIGAQATDEDAEQTEQQRIDCVKAEIIEVGNMQIDKVEYSGGYIETKSCVLKVRILKGEHKDSIVEAIYSIDELNPVNTYEFKKWDKVLLYLEEDMDGNIADAYVAELVRESYILYLVAGFVLMLLIVGGVKGLKAIVSLILTCFAVIRILLPMILRGVEPIGISIAVCVGITAVTLVIVSGINKKTLTAAIGTSCGLLAAGAIALLAGSAARLTGLGTQEAQMLMYIPQDINFNFKGLLFASIIIGALGAVMDVGMSVASSMNEIEKANPEIKTGMLIKAGMSVGRDIMGTMSNTLILAYTGGSLQFLLLLMAYKMPVAEIINTDFMTSEILRALAGSIGLIMTIPITALVAGLLRKGRKVQDGE